MDTPKETKSTVETVCKCGHAWGVHYLIQAGWPACSQCEKCHKFEPASQGIAKEESTP